jgi:hypothetical protein
LQPAAAPRRGAYHWVACQSKPLLLPRQLLMGVRIVLGFEMR